MQDIFISLGSNLGSPVNNLYRACDWLSQYPGLHKVATSTIYQTEPQGYKEQPWFANQVLWMHGDSTWEPSQLLAVLKQMEEDMGRTHGPRYGPRLIDLDILLFNGLVRREKDLILPHPGLKSRAFVLIPLLEICPDISLPDGTKVQQLLTDLDYELDGNKIFQS